MSPQPTEQAAGWVVDFKQSKSETFMISGDIWGYQHWRPGGDVETIGI